MPVEMITDETLTDSGFYWREANGIKVLVSTALECNGFANGFSTRLGGVSPFPENDLNLAGFNEDLRENIFENRRRFLAVFPHQYRLAAVFQVHGNAVKVVEDDADISDSDDKADAMASDLDGILLGVKTADCVPVLIGDTGTKSYAAIHAGWRGTVQSIVIKAVDVLKNRFGAEPKNMIAAIGPAAGCGNYEIGSEVMDAFRDNFSESSKYFKPTREGHALVDLHLANRDQLISCGIDDKNIYTAPFCTMDRVDLFFSYRLEKVKNGKTGRLLSVIGRS